VYSSEISGLTEPGIPYVPDYALQAIKRRVREFERLRKDGIVKFNFRPFLDLEVEATVETELAFCISTANSSARSGLKFQKSLEDLDLSKIDVEKLEKLLKEAGVRFHRKKAFYIRHALEKFASFKADWKPERDLLVKEFYGLGLKEASHFLRNLGEKNVAILDRHILRWLGYDHRSLTRKRYAEAEIKLQKIASEYEISVSELDLMIWFSKTKMVLK
jgi:N-glycosylase/DNA lyase